MTSPRQKHTRVDLVGVVNENGGSLSFYKVNPTTRKLELINDVKLGKSNPYGGCMYLSPVSKKYYFFVNWQDGMWQQVEVNSNGSSISGTVVRSHDAGSQTEGCVVDDVHKLYYIGEEAKGIWRYGAEPGDGTTRISVDNTSSGRLKADVEGMSIYYKSNGQGYLIVSSQGNSTFAVYERVPQGTSPNTYIGSFKVGANGNIDEANGTDGLDVTNVPLGSTFSRGMLVVHDDTPKPSVNKYVPFEHVAEALGLTLDTTWNPRSVGSNGPIPTVPTTRPTNTVVPSQPVCPSIPNNAGKASFTVTIKGPGDYKVWSRMRNEDQYNAYLLKISGVNNDCPIVVGDVETVDMWSWVDYKNGTVGDKIILNLQAGVYTFTLIGHEPRVGIDKLLITKELTCTPTGTGENCESIPVTATPVPSSTPKPTVTKVPISVSPGEPSPSLVPSSGPGTLSLQPIADTFVNSERPRNNYGKEKYLFVDGDPKRIIYFKFDLNQPQLKGKTITDVRLRVRVAKGASAPKDIRFVSNSSWAETGINYDNRPAPSSTVVGTINTRMREEMWLQVPINAQNVQSNIGNNYSLAISHPAKYRFDVYSRETAYPPLMVITYK